MNSRSDFELFDFVSVEANNSYLVEDIPDLKWLLQPTSPLILPPWPYQYSERAGCISQPPHVAGKMMGWSSYAGAAEPPAAT